MSKSRRRVQKSFEVGQVQVSIVSYGHDAPDPKRYPTRCLMCHKRVVEGDTWQVHDNGEYQIIVHSACAPA